MTETNRMEVLDVGYVKLVRHWGSDEEIVETARMSTAKGFEGWGPKPDGTPGDEKLLRFMYENEHTGPFEFAGATFEVAAPIAVFREWHRHRTQSYSEMSARYVPLPDENYLMSVERLLQVNVQVKNKQATSATTKELTRAGAEEFLAYAEHAYTVAQDAYERGINLGVAKELARMPVPVARYSRMRASTDLHNWIKFLCLRSSLKNPNAQWEIRQYADAIAKMLAEHFPRTMALYAEPTPLERDRDEWKRRALEAEEKLQFPELQLR